MWRVVARMIAVPGEREGEGTDGRSLAGVGERRLGEVGDVEL